MSSNSNNNMHEQRDPSRSKNSEEVLGGVLGDIELSAGDTISSFFAGKLTEVLAERAEQGKLKYGTYLTTFNGRDSIRDLNEELFDALFYLKQASLEGLITKSTYIQMHDSLLQLLILADEG